MPFQILLIARDSPDRDLVKRTLIADGHRVTVTETCAGALARLGQAHPSLVIVDLEDEHDSLKLLRSLKGARDAPPLVAIAAYGRSEFAARALSLGVVDLVRRPIDASEVVGAVSNAAEFASLAPVREQPVVLEHQRHLFGSSPVMQGVLNTVRRLATLRCSVLIVGERGTGRDMVAEAIHMSGPRADQPFVTIDCDDVRGQELEAAVLGTSLPVKKAKAATAEPGAPERRSTLYLRDLERLRPSLQLKLERILQGHGTAPARYLSDSPSDVRIVAGAAADITDALQRDSFRRDLFDCLATVRIDLPPLRHRAQDIPLLASYFLKDACRQHEIPGKTFVRSALTLLSKLPWRGNAQELRTLTERLAVLVPRGVILLEDVLAQVSFEGAEATGQARGSLRMARMRFERDYVTTVLQRHHGRMSTAARELEVERTNLYRKIKNLEIKW